MADRFRQERMGVRRQGIAAAKVTQLQRSSKAGFGWIKSSCMNCGCPVDRANCGGGVLCPTCAKLSFAKLRMGTQKFFSQKATTRLVYFRIAKFGSCNASAFARKIGLRPDVYHAYENWREIRNTEENRALLLRLQKLGLNLAWYYNGEGRPFAKAKKGGKK